MQETYVIMSFSII